MAVEIAGAVSLEQAIRQRRSFPLKQLLQEPVSRDLIEQVLEAANWAPSHGQTEPWRFRVYTAETRRTLGAAFAEAYAQLNPGDRFDPATQAMQRDRVWQAPVWISLGMQPAMNEQGAPRMPEWEEIVAFGSAVQNMHLTATSLGLGGKWTSGAVAVHTSVAEFVGIQNPGRLFGFFYLGWPAITWPQGSRRPLHEKVTWAE